MLPSVHGCSSAVERGESATGSPRHVRHGQWTSQDIRDPLGPGVWCGCMSMKVVKRREDRLCGGRPPCVDKPEQYAVALVVA